MTTDIIKVNLGCGKKLLDGYINIDKQLPADLIHRIGVDALPFKENIVDGAEADNFMEHLTFEEFLFTMNDLWRIMKPGAILKIRVPDTIAWPAGAFGDPTHKLFFTGKTFDYFTPCGTYRVNGEAYGFKLWIKAKPNKHDGKFITAQIKPVKNI